MKFSLWTKYGALNSKPVFEAFKKSIVNQGFYAEENDPTADVDVIWSVLWNGRMAPNRGIFNNGKPTIVLEVGGINRGVTWKVGLNGIGPDNCMLSRNNTSERATQLGLKALPWTRTGEHILICCQNPKSHMWESMPATLTWLDDTIAVIRAVSARRIIVRPHPRVPLRTIPKYADVVLEQPTKIPDTYDDFDLTFSQAHAVVSWSSNPGPQAVLSGVPAFVGPDSLARDVASTNLYDIERPRYPDRQQWLNDYAHTEYTVDEISQGIPLDNLLKSLDF